MGVVGIVSVGEEYLMTHAFALPALITLLTYLALFFWAGRIASRAAGGSIWLFGQAKGRERLAAIGFRLSFALAALGLIWGAAQGGFGYSGGGNAAFGLIGLALSNVGAMIAFGAQLSMGASWRVGVRTGAVGPLVSGGLYVFSRNPTFVGQGLLLLGAFLAAPSLLGLIGAALFAWSAATQVASEEAALAEAHGAEYEAFKANTPRWLGWGH